MTVGSFEKALREHDLLTLLCWFLPPHRVWHSRIEFKPQICLRSLKVFLINEIGGSMVQARRYWEPLLDSNGAPSAQARKNRNYFPHAIRLLELAVQIVEQRCVSDFTPASDLFAQAAVSELSWAEFFALHEDTHRQLIDRLKKVIAQERDKILKVEKTIATLPSFVDPNTPLLPVLVERVSTGELHRAVGITAARSISNPALLHFSHVKHNAAFQCLAVRESCGFVMNVQSKKVLNYPMKKVFPFKKAPGTRAQLLPIALDWSTASYSTIVEGYTCHLFL
jgi:hypothetical protein